MNSLVKKTLIIIPVTVIAAAVAMGLKPIKKKDPEVSAVKATMSVTLKKPENTKWPVQLAASGMIGAWQEAIISAETGGLRITALHADVGDRVKRGQVLAELARDSVQADLHRYEAELSSAKATLAQAKANADRARQIKGSGALSEQQVNAYLATEKTAQANLEVAEARLEAQKVILTHTQIVAVDDGIITTRNALLGQVVTAGTELFRMQRQGKLEWQAEVDAKQLGMVKEGARCNVTLPSGKILEGAVRLASPTLSASTSRANVYVSLGDEPSAKAGMFASGTIEAGEQTVLTVPESSLVLRDGRSYLFEAGGDNRVARRRVTTGMYRDGFVEIASGLSIKARVVTSGGAFLADGDVVTVAGE